MAELALAIIPLGITVTSGLVKYLKAFSDHDEDRARLARQAERFESTFQSLDTVLKRSQLTPELSVSASEASVCLRECQTALKELETLQQKIFSTTTSAGSTTAHARTKDKIKDGCKKLIYPLRRPDIETLQEALDKLSTPLTLALGMLHLDEESLTRKILNEQTVEIQRNTVVSSNTSTVIEGLRHPISQIGSSLPVLQTSVDAIVPHFDQRFDQISYLMSYQQAQIKSLLDIAGQARNQHHLEPKRQPSSNHSGEQGNYLAACEIQQELRAPSSRADSVSMCSCQRRRIMRPYFMNLSSPCIACQDLWKGQILLWRELLDYYEQNQSVARIHYGPLSLAIIRNNLSEVERLLSLYPHMIEEESYYRETPLHLAIYRPDILKALAKKARPELWVLFSNDNATALTLALKVSRNICNSEKGLDESCCPCTLPLRVIFAAGCPIIPYRDFSCYHGLRSKDCFFEASLHCKTLLAKELRSRRLQLLDLARNKLSITEISNFTPLEKVPDNDAIEIDRLLRQKGILSLGPLSTFVDEDLRRWHRQGVVHCYIPIFFYLASPEDANVFIDAEFEMPCADQGHDSSLERALIDQECRRTYLISVEYAIWLFDRRAPLWKWSYRFTGPMSSIFVLADILGIHKYERPNHDDANGKAEEYLSKSVLIDKCSCLCSPDGCTPFTSRMKWLAHPNKQDEDLTLQDYAMSFGSHVAVYGRGLNLRHHTTMVRQSTFSALKLRHTCLDRPGYSGHPYGLYWMYCIDPVTELEPDEKEFEILNVDVEAKNQLDEVVAMFQDFVLTGRETAMSSESDTFDLDYSAFDEPSAPGIDDLYYKRVLEFWDHIWVGRMEVALDAVAKGWEDKLHGQDDLVQISTCEEADEETEDREEIDDDVIFNRIIQRIQDI
ncbi:hypothetical protein FPCIR_12853 [Fusarium pseudocircinatum]|uniref:Fungal N-terminal domain-containing protein n=1 Tax=Fusarium pseudocircinatum TaxID=56676 RepID=A0A8H5NRD3_9HYPO|nr:hypothetical protein FPCIR_12853 [Fusarium pseudocircinatum]